MFNLIKMDTHRLAHTLSSWVIMAFAIGAAVFSVAMTNLDIEAVQDDPPVGLVVEDKTSDDDSGVVAGIYVTGEETWANGEDIELGQLIGMEMQSGLTAILCVIFAALFANADQKNGFIKNIAGQFPRRGKLILSKIAAAAVWILLMLLVFSAAIAVTGFIFWGDRVYMASLTPLARALGVQYLLHLGFASLILLFVTLTRSTAFSTTAGILICSGMTVFLYSGVNQVVSNLRPEWDFDVSRYMLESNIRLIGPDSPSDLLLQGAAVGAAFSIVSVIVAMILIKKRDIR